MAISVNGIEIDDIAIERELKHHQDADNPLKRAVHELVLRTVLLQQADILGISADDDEQRIEALLAFQVKVPKADEAACETWYRNNQARYTSGELVEARHILPSVPEQVFQRFLPLQPVTVPFYQSIARMLYFTG